MRDIFLPRRNPALLRGVDAPDGVSLQPSLRVGWTLHSNEFI
jgi:hypothetical protein